MKSIARRIARLERARRAPEERPTLLIVPTDCDTGQPCAPTPTPEHECQKPGFCYTCAIAPILSEESNE
jgi:hypothetical protein